MLEVKEFELLRLMEMSKVPLTQREMAEASGVSVGTVNKVVSDLQGGGLVERGSITSEGLEALEPYRVRRAVLIAAGFGSRMVPITLNTPKPLVRVHGERIIDSLLDALLAVGIDEIYVVRGYLGEQFDQLLYKYPMIRFIDNPLYNEANNISSVLLARQHLENAYVFESDLLLYNKDLVQKYQYSSNYLGVPVAQTDDWCFETKRGIITKLGVGGRDCHHMFGVSYWTAEDGRKLIDDVKATYGMPGGKERYWDEVPLTYCKDHYQVHVRQCSFEDVIEIDTFRELQELDSAYAS